MIYWWLTIFQYHGLLVVSYHQFALPMLWSITNWWSPTHHILDGYCSFLSLLVIVKFAYHHQVVICLVTVHCLVSSNNNLLTNHVNQRLRKSQERSMSLFVLWIYCMTKDGWSDESTISQTHKCIFVIILVAIYFSR